MNSLWNEDEARSFSDDPLSLRVYTSRLLGRDPALVMHGGGNTSVKVTTEDFFGDPVDVLYVKGSGWDLGTIEAEGFAPVRLDVLKRLATLEHLSDSDMVRQQRTAMLDPSAPGPSVEAILHAILPFRFVDHTHADAAVAITNTPDGEERIRELYGDRVLIVPYVMPGFVLARTIYERTRDTDWSALEGMILVNHGVFTFHDDGRESYERMIRLVDEAEKALHRAGALAVPAVAADPPKPPARTALARLRRKVGELRGAPVLVRLDDSPDARGFVRRPDAEAISGRGPLTPDHVIRTKRVPAFVGENIGEEVDEGTGQAEAVLDAYREDYEGYFADHDDGSLSRLDPAPRVVLWPPHGSLACGRSVKEVGIIEDIARHTRRAIQWSEHLDAWEALPEADIFDVEYWELEQAKLAKAGGSPPFQGRVALVSGAASGIGRATAQALLDRGAAVVGLDIDPAIGTLSEQAAGLGLVCDLADADAIEAALDRAVSHFGGLDLLVSNAGLFTPSRTLEAMDDELWQRSLDINLTAHLKLTRAAIPLLAEGFEPAIVFVASKNVPAPGKAAGAYSVAKAGLAQVARVAALELGERGIRVNVVHPDGVFDTALWTEEILAARAAHYGLTVEQYRKRNLLGVEVGSADVAEAICALLGPAFRATTGAQVPIDGGNDRVV